MHTFWNEERKNIKLSSLPPSVEGQTHLLLERKEGKKMSL